MSDTGTGIPEEIRTRIFEPFFTTKEVGAGTGLGLATVYAIVEQHLGQIEIESQLGEGTTFSVYLPLAASGSCTGTVEPAALPRGGSELVLVAEDDAFVRDWVERVLTNAGYAVITATTGPEAIALFRARASEIDMVLLDYCLPGATGAEVHRSIQVLAPAVPCLVCTAYDSRAPQTTYMRDNRLTILHKPYEKNALLFAIRAALDVPCASEALAGLSGVNA